MFLLAVGQMVEDLQAQRPFRPGPRVKGFRRFPGVFEMTRAKNGRALFKCGTSPRQGETHITWLRIGTHDIYR